MTFKPFQFLYQTFKGVDQRLFDTLERIHMYLEELFNADNAVLTISGTNDLILETFSKNVPGLSLNLKKPGTWLILVNLECQHVAGDGDIEFKIVCNGIYQAGMGVAYSGADTLRVVTSKFWVFRNGLGVGENLNIRVSARLTSSASMGSKIISQNSSLAAIWQNSDV